MTNLWCLMAYFVILYDFFYEHALGGILPSVLVIYVAILVIYVGLKEFERWYEIQSGRHPGELFVIGWTIVMLVLVIGKIFLHKQTPIPEEAISTYIAVLSIMAISQKSKRLKEEKDHNN